MSSNPWHPTGRQLAIDEIIAHLQFAKETDDLDYLAYLTSLIHYNEISKHLLPNDPLRVFLVSLGYFKPRMTKNEMIQARTEKQKRNKINRKFNPRIF